MVRDHCEKRWKGRCTTRSSCSNSTELSEDGYRDILGPDLERQQRVKTGQLSDGRIETLWQSRNVRDEESNDLRHNKGDLRTDSRRSRFQRVAENLKHS